MNQRDAVRWGSVAQVGAVEERRRLAERLREFGIAPTPQRIDIASALFEKGGHYSVSFPVKRTVDK